eukprot:UN04123
MHKKDTKNNPTAKPHLINLNDKEKKHKNIVNNNQGQQYSNDNNNSINNKNKNTINVNTSNTLSNNQSTNTQVFHTPHIIITPCVTNNNTLDVCI